MRREDLALAGGRFHDQRTGDVLADIEIARTVVGHAVALVARIAHLDDAVPRAPSAADIARHVAEIEALLLGFQIGPSLKRNPVQTCSTGASRSTRRSSSGG